jgi:hypothetical protein
MTRSKECVRTGSYQKVKAERAGPPTFDIIVEFRPKAGCQSQMVHVDSILQGVSFKVQRRVRDPASGSIQI